MENEFSVNKINKIENQEFDLRFYKNQNQENNNLNNGNNNFSDELQKEVEKYEIKYNDIKEKEMNCAIDLMKEDFNLDELVQIFEFTYQEFYNHLNNNLQQSNNQLYNLILEKLNKEKFERTKHK